jgi:ubiquinone/menaquinone biosynthesis C-methylase UbiE
MYNGKEAYYGEIAKNYEKDRISQSIWEKEQQWVSTFLDTIPSKSSILDIPVGTGRFIPNYQKKNFTIFGIDISKDMINQARKKLDSPYTTQTKYVLKEGDAENLEFETGAVDYIICFRLFHLIPLENIIQISKEFFRVCNTKVVVEVFNTSFIQERKNSIRQKLKMKIVKWFNQKEKMQNIELVNEPWRHINNFYFKRDRLEKVFTEVGFKIESVQQLEDQENAATIYILQK